MFQRGDGHFGAYVVRQTMEDDSHAGLYDYDLTEHIIIAQEWFHTVIKLFTVPDKQKWSSYVTDCNRHVLIEP